MEELVLGFEPVNLGVPLAQGLVKVSVLAGHRVADAEMILLQLEPVLVLGEKPAHGKPFGLGAAVPVRTGEPIRSLPTTTHRPPGLPGSDSALSSSQLTSANSASSALSLA